MPPAHKLLRSMHPATLCWAATLGAISGAAATAVRLSFVGLQWVFTGSKGTLPTAAAGLPLWRRFLTPVIGALLATAVLTLRHRRAASLDREPRPFVDYVEAGRKERGRIPLVPNLWRTGSSAFSIATGAAIGREGSMIQFSAAVTSGLQRRACARWGWPCAFPATLGVACGVAGGVATAYQAPIAAVFFAMEIALGAYRMEDLAPVSCAAVAGWLVSRTVLRDGPLYPVGTLPHLSLAPLLCLALLTVLIGCLGPAYQWLVRAFERLHHLPLSLAVGGAVVGGLSLLDPRVWGNGDEGLSAALGLHLSSSGAITWTTLLTLLVLRLLATSACVGAGTVGGVFTPTLFAGALLGAIFARVLPVGDPVIFALVAMSCLIAAATHAPLMATFMAVELTGEWHLLPLLFAANLLAWQVAKRLSPAALYAIATDRPEGHGRLPPTPQ